MHVRHEARHLKLVGGVDLVGMLDPLGVGVHNREATGRDLGGAPRDGGRHGVARHNREAMPTGADGRVGCPEVGSVAVGQQPGNVVFVFRASRYAGNQRPLFLALHIGEGEGGKGDILAPVEQHFRGVVALLPVLPEHLIVVFSLGAGGPLFADGGLHVVDDAGALAQVVKIANLRGESRSVDVGRHRQLRDLVLFVQRGVALFHHVQLLLQLGGVLGHLGFAVSRVRLHAVDGETHFRVLSLHLAGPARKFKALQWHSALRLPYVVSEF